MNTGELVVVAAASPREKFWGVLVSLSAAGVTLRGISVESYEDWLQECATDEPRLLGPITLFIPSHRIERVEADETVGAVEGLGDRFHRVTGKLARAELERGAQSPADDRPEM